MASVFIGEQNIKAYDGGMRVQEHGVCDSGTGKIT